MWNMTNTQFADWLILEVEKRGWSYRELGRRAELSASTISKVITGASLAGKDFCTGVARALGFPPELVFRKAGLLPPTTDVPATVTQVAYLVAQLDESDQHDVIAMIEALLERRKKGGYNDEGVSIA